ncbi:uncharacterized protein CEXT_68261 [Caerostris extrusa]|uniref:CSD domain-containing protein n=1 Tax=Caerostris extrusa TaxID=172846 RepID=A0AAV4UW14_CAEEX|nr:uncharacterized protein CEXT_68261 [Caerostris extrusa]
MADIASMFPEMDMKEIKYAEFIVSRIEKNGGSLKFQHLTGQLSQLEHDIRSAIGSGPKELMHFFKKYNDLFVVKRWCSVSSKISLTLKKTWNDSWQKVCLNAKIGDQNFESKYRAVKVWVPKDVENEVLHPDGFHPKVPKTRDSGLYDANTSEGWGRYKNVFDTYGFITVENDKKNNVFFHKSKICNVENVQDLTKVLKPGDVVEYKAVRSQKNRVRWEATKVWIRKKGYQNGKKKESSNEPINKVSNKVVKKDLNSKMITNEVGKIYPNSKGVVIKFGERESKLADADSCNFFIHKIKVEDVTWEFSDGDAVTFDGIKIKSVPGYKALLAWVGAKPDVVPLPVEDFDEFTDEDIDTPETENFSNASDSNERFSKKPNGVCNSTSSSASNFSRKSYSQSRSRIDEIKRHSNSNKDDSYSRSSSTSRSSQQSELNRNAGRSPSRDSRSEKQNRSRSRNSRSSCQSEYNREKQNRSRSRNSKSSYQSGHNREKQNKSRHSKSSQQSGFKRENRSSSRNSRSSQQSGFNKENHDRPNSRSSTSSQQSGFNRENCNRPNSKNSNLNSKTRFNKNRNGSYSRNSGFNKENRNRSCSRNSRLSQQSNFNKGNLSRSSSRNSLEMDNYNGNCSLLSNSKNSSSESLNSISNVKKKSLKPDYLYESWGDTPFPDEVADSVDDINLEVHDNNIQHPLNSSKNNKSSIPDPIFRNNKAKGIISDEEHSGNSSHSTPNLSQEYSEVLSDNFDTVKDENETLKNENKMNNEKLNESVTDFQDNIKNIQLEKPKSYIKRYEDLDGVVKKVYCKYAEVENDKFKKPCTFFCNDLYHNGAPVSDKFDDLNEVLSIGHIVKFSCFEIVDDSGCYFHKVTVAWKGAKPKVTEVSCEKFIAENNLNVTAREVLIDDIKENYVQGMRHLNTKSNIVPPRKFLTVESDLDDDDDYDDDEEEEDDNAKNNVIEENKESHQSRTFSYQQDLEITSNNSAVQEYSQLKETIFFGVFKSCEYFASYR